MAFLYETHMHTSEASACGKYPGKDMARAYKAAGYDGIIVTDHFFNGNCAISSTLPWNQRVDAFLSGYEAAKAEGDRIGLKVFLGWEYCDMGTEFLTYGLGRDFLLQYPNMLFWTPQEYIDKVHEHNGFISQAHPFREASYIDFIRLFYKSVDAFEVYNAGNIDPAMDEEAQAFASSHHLAMTAGTDAHCPEVISGAGMLFMQQLTDIWDFISSVKEGKGRIVSALSHTN